MHACSTEFDSGNKERPIMNKSANNSRDSFYDSVSQSANQSVVCMLVWILPLYYIVMSTMYAVVYIVIKQIHGINCTCCCLVQTSEKAEYYMCAADPLWQRRPFLSLIYSFFSLLSSQPQHTHFFAVFRFPRKVRFSGKHFIVRALR